jgi:hypothetical protein
MRDGLRALGLRRARLVGCRTWLAGRFREARHCSSDAYNYFVQRPWTRVRLSDGRAGSINRRYLRACHVDAKDVRSREDVGKRELTRLARRRWLKKTEHRGARARACASGG